MHRLPSFLIVSLFCSLLAAPAAAGELRAVNVDGDMSDWDGAAVVHDDSGDGAFVDFGRLWMANDQDRLYLRFETGGEVQPDEQQDLRLYLDTDLNAGTGFSIQGIGADLVWELGNRNGTFYTPSARSIDHPDIGLQIGPTVSNTVFELALARDAVPSSGVALFPGNSVRVVLRDADGGDTLPSSGSVTYDFAAGSIAPASNALARFDADDVRVMGWNVENDGLFDGDASREAAIQRKLEVIDADVLVFCEVWNHSASQVVSLMNSYLPGSSWSGVGLDGGNVIVSRYPILDSWEIFPGHRLSAVRVDLRPDVDSDFVVVANHWRCCTADLQRQDEADALVEWLHDARNPGGSVTLATDTPIVAVGDFNLVGWRQQLDTLLTGDIQDEGSFGPDSPPDWDGSTLDVVPSRHPDTNQAYTWFSATSSFYPGLLDFIFYTESVLELANHFTLDTRTMDGAALAAAGLFANDSDLASDHTPRVADFHLPVTTSVDGGPVGRAELKLRAVPNPFNPRTQIHFDLPEAARVELRIFDGRGREVRALAARGFEAGPHAVTWNGLDDQGHVVPSGVYHARLEAGAWRRSTSLVLVR